MACPKGRAIHYIFSFPKEGKEKDIISIPHANSFSKQLFLEYLKSIFQNNNPKKNYFFIFLK